MLENILDSCRLVLKDSKHVKIDEKKLNEFCAQNINISTNYWLMSSPYGLLDMPVYKIINFMIVYESINFSFWGNPKWTIDTSFGKEDGSMALLYALLKYVKENDSIDFSNITESEFKDILKGNIEIPLLKERYEIIKQVSGIIKDKMNNDFYNYIKDVNKDKDLFEIIVSNFSNFKDERDYFGNTIYFYKLAQLLTSDILHIRNLKENVDVDLSNLLGCSDYKIPQVLRGMGITIYDDELSNIIDSKQEIEKNSDYEIEIRAGMIVVIDKIKERLNGKVSSIDINDFIWSKSKDKNIDLKPYHLTRCTNY